MDKIEGKLPVLDVIRGSYDKTTREIKHKLADLGLNETMSYTLIPNEKVLDEAEIEIFDLCNQKKTLIKTGKKVGEIKHE